MKMFHLFTLPGHTPVPPVLESCQAVLDLAFCKFSDTAFLVRAKVDKYFSAAWMARFGKLQKAQKVLASRQMRISRDGNDC